MRSRRASSGTSRTGTASRGSQPTAMPPRAGQTGRLPERRTIWAARFSSRRTVWSGCIRARRARHQIVTTRCSGVRRGDWRSVQVVDGKLYYHSAGGVCVFDGSLPVVVSQVLGEERYTDAAAGSLDGRYYLSAKGADGVWVLLVYDARRGLWHAESGVPGGWLYARWGEPVCAECGRNAVGSHGARRDAGGVRFVDG